ncbi:hypothetical protein A3747_12815 [Sulfitobacter sp. HI0076]|nr:hypothetical protein A3720_04715 [Sulfitobacter sp. HI0021]KZX95398.1 hypothetical protein A3722_18475 [Sulfitobacter sp. HI0027]KZZ03158.1 hypothetical protein A3747_12815 [Sulfitobacter sp. HI0076]
MILLRLNLLMLPVELGRYGLKTLRIIWSKLVFGVARLALISLEQLNSKKYHLNTEQTLPTALIR